MKSVNRLRIAISLVAGAALVVHLAFPGIGLDAIAIGLGILVFLPWLDRLVRSIEVPGVGKIELAEVRNEALQARGAAESTGRQLDTILAGGAQTLASATVGSAGEGEGARTVRLQALSEEYDDLRREAPNPKREKEERRIMGEMIAVARGMKVGSDEVWEMLGSNVPRKGGSGTSYGHVLAATALAYVHAHAAPIPKLTETAVARFTPIFNRYWALVALRRALEARGFHFMTSQDEGALKALRDSLPEGSDARSEADRILATANDAGMNSIVLELERKTGWDFRRSE